MRRNEAVADPEEVHAAAIRALVGGEDLAKALASKGPTAPPSSGEPLQGVEEVFFDVRLEEAL